MLPSLKFNNLKGRDRLVPAPIGSLRPSFVALLVLACGVLSPIKLELMGEVFAPELALPIVALIARLTANGSRGIREPVFVVFFAAGILTLLGYAVSDLVQGSRPEQFLRGWGRVALVISDFICLAVIFGQDRRNFWWFGLGSGLGGILFLYFIEGAPLALWKFGYADPVVQVSAALGVFLPMIVTSAWIGLLGVYSMFADFRSFAAICLAVAALVLLRIGRRDRHGSNWGSVVKLSLAGGAVLVALSATLSMTDDGGSRRSESDAGRQAAFETGLVAVLRSPVIGYGSWAENREVTKMYLDRTHQLLGGTGAGSPPPGKRIKFNPHSQILHAWFEGGMLASAFFVVMLAQIVRQGPWLLVRRPLDALTPLLLFILLATVWNLFMSPFAAAHRLGIALGAAMLVMLRVEQRHSMLPTVAPEYSVDGAGKLPSSVPTQRAVRYGQRRLRWLPVLRHVATKRT